MRQNVPPPDIKNNKKCNEGVIRVPYFNGTIIRSCDCEKGKEEDRKPNLRPCWIQN